MNLASIDNTNVASVAGQCTNPHHITVMDNTGNVI